MQPHPFFPAVLCIELLVLIAGVFLKAYIAKQQLSKWYAYGSAVIVIFTVLLMACTCCMVCCMRHCEQGKMQGECGMEEGFHHRMMMEHMYGHGCMRERECCDKDDDECCEMKGHCEKEEGEESCKNGGEKKECEMKEKEEMEKKEVKEEKKK